MISGTVKSCNFEKGYGFVTSPEFGNQDVFLLKADNVPLAAKGDQVTFSVLDTEKGPEAKDVSIVTRGEGSFKGTVKSFNKEKRFGWISCDITKEIFGKDVFFMKTDISGGFVSPGATVIFGVRQTDKGPEGVKVKPWEGKSNTNWSNTNWSNTNWRTQGTQKGYGQTTNMGKGGSMKGSMSQERVLGVVKTFNAEKGWGFIETQQLGGEDVFLLGKEMAGEQPNVGDTVQFTVSMASRGIQAKDVTKVTVDGDMHGTVKCFNPAKGWGFITPDINQDMGDVFLHKRDLGELEVNSGDKLRFNVIVNKHGHAQASNVRVHHGWGEANASTAKKPWRSSPY
jgi:cold shock CspA family protein